MTGKQVKCKDCNRMFATAAALSQHMRIKHAAGKPKAKAQRMHKDASVSMASKPRANVNTETATLSGTDIIASIPNIMDFSVGKLIINQEITPGLMPRLKTVARAFQKIKYNKLVFRVEPQVSTATSGGYVAAFVHDPSDIPAEGPTSTPNFLLAQSSSVTTKWWESSLITCKNMGNRVYYTSESKEVREYSPGSFMLTASGKATQSGNLVVYAEWNVTLSQASYENDKELEELSRTLVPLYMRTTFQGVFGLTSGSSATRTWTSDIKAMISNIGDATSWKLPAALAIQDGESDAKFSVRLAHWLSKDGTNIQLGFEGPSDKMKNVALDEVLLVPAGTILEVATRSSSFQEASSSNHPPRRFNEMNASMTSSLESLSFSDLNQPAQMPTSKILSQLSKILKELSLRNLE